AVRLRWLRTNARRGAAGADVVALVQCSAHDRIGPRTRAALTGIVLRTGVAIVTGRAVRFGGVRAGAIRRITSAGVVTLIRGSTDNWVPARTRTVQARVGRRACVAIVTGRAVRLGRVRAGARRRIASAGVMTLIRRGACD